MRMRSVLAALAAPALIAGGVLAATAGPAFASDNANGTGLYAHNPSCDGATDLSEPAGFVNFHQDGTTVTAIVHLRDAAPDESYYVLGYYGCGGYSGSYGQVMTNDQGLGNGTFSFQVPAGETYFIYGYDFTPFTNSTFESVAVTP